jgi:hypothetical protein
MPETARAQFEANLVQIERKPAHRAETVARNREKPRQTAKLSIHLPFTSNHPVTQVRNSRRRR